MNTVITEDRIETYAYFLNDILAVVEMQIQGRVRRPRRDIVNLLDAMSDACMILSAQVAGGIQITHHDIASLKHKACGAMRTVQTESRTRLSTTSKNFSG